MALVASELRIERGAKRLVDALDLRLEPGRITVVLGANGAGKSSLLLTLAGVLAPASGQIELDGRPLAAWSHAERGRRVAWQGELPSAEFGFTVMERLSLVASETRAAGDALARLELETLAERRLFELSAGERQRVELASLWLRDAPIWLLDEPTSHLDIRHQVACLRMLRAEAAEGRSVVAVLHDLTQAHAVADFALLLDPQAGAQFGEAERLLRSEQLVSVFGTPVQEAEGPGGRALLPVYSERPPA